MDEFLLLSLKKRDDFWIDFFPMLDSGVGFP